MMENRVARAILSRDSKSIKKKLILVSKLWHKIGQSSARYNTKDDIEDAARGTASVPEE